ncbi:RDD family protein [Actinoplanes sp. NPDC024001]|uniref:RDD family protein n=1 Tax=Actinoplanes sp. NPDC024001 TaxID=3154598 RepID=UPI0033DCF13E
MTYDPHRPAYTTPAPALQQPPVTFPSFVPPPPPANSVLLVSVGGRAAALLLDLMLFFLTMYIGWIVWSVYTWGTGQTPAKKILGHVVADANTGAPIDWHRMFRREVLGKILVGFFTGGMATAVDALGVLRRDRRTLHDQATETIVRYE